MPQNPVGRDRGRPFGTGMPYRETDKYDLQDSPSDSELLGTDEDDADDYSDDSMELPPHPCQKRFTTRLKRLSAN
jgi:hypothetical protein